MGLCGKKKKGTSRYIIYAGPLEMGLVFSELREEKNRGDKL